MPRVATSQLNREECADEGFLRSERCIIAADLHLDGADAAPLERLLAEAQAREADLILLGDVFHYWFGPKHLDISMYEKELELLAQATPTCRVTIVPGNRDFLLDEHFTRRTGVAVAGDYVTLLVGRERFLLTHGDLFCTADVHYQRMRRLFRNGMLLFIIRRMPGFLVRRLADRLRRHSESVVQKKPAPILEPDLGFIASVKEDHDAVICGHFHEFRDETLPRVSGGGRFLVVEPYEDRGFVLTIDSDGIAVSYLNRQPGDTAHADQQD